MITLAQFDILRGEESETFGILELLDRHGPLLILLPGSHTKLLLVDEQSRIAASYTTIGGEILQALAQHTIVASSVDWPPPGEPIWSAVDHGASFARAWGLARGAFAVRLADVLVDTDRAFRSWFLVGLVVASDWGELMRWPQLSKDTEILIGGREPLRSAYGRQAKLEWGPRATILEQSIADAASARGALAIARYYRTGQSAS